MKVRATLAGYHGEYRKPDDVFDVPEDAKASWFKPVDGEASASPDSPLSHESDGNASPAAAEQTDELTLLRDQYKAAFGKKAFAGWDAEKLRAKLSAGPEQEA
jgi:hypothetical protein